MLCWKNTPLNSQRRLSARYVCLFAFIFMVKTKEVAVFHLLLGVLFNREQVVHSISTCLLSWARGCHLLFPPSGAGTSSATIPALPPSFLQLLHLEVSLRATPLLCLPDHHPPSSGVQLDSLGLCDGPCPLASQQCEVGQELIHDSCRRREASPDFQNLLNFFKNCFNFFNLEKA